MEEDICRISFSLKIPASENTFQISFSNIFNQSRNHKNLFLVLDSGDVYDKLYYIMEKYDAFDAFSIYCDNLKEIFGFLEFLRQENPKKIINVYCFDEKPEVIENESIFEIIDHLEYL